MAEGVSITLVGAKELDRKLKQLNYKVARKITRQSLREGAKIIQAQAKANAPVGETGILKRSLKVAAGRSRRGVISIVVITKEGFYKGKAFYGAFLEFGTKHIAPRGFIRAAYDSKRRAALRAILWALRLNIDREAASK